MNRVLLAHRDPVVQEIAARTLARVGATLDIAADTADALARIARDSYSVITIERDDAVLAAIAAACARPRPVVIVTAESSQGLDPETVSLLVPEPYDPHTLVGVMLACVTPGNAPAGESAFPGELADNL